MLFNYALTSLALSAVAYAMPVVRQVGAAPTPDAAGTTVANAGTNALAGATLQQIQGVVDGGSGPVPNNGVAAPGLVTRVTKYGSPPTLGKASENSVDVPATRGANSNGPQTLEEADESGLNAPGLVSTGGTNSNGPSLIPRVADDCPTLINTPGSGPVTLAASVCTSGFNPGSKTDGTNAGLPVPASNAISVVSLQNRADPTGSDVADGTDTPLRAGVTSGSLAFEYPGSLADSPNPALPVRK